MLKPHELSEMSWPILDLLSVFQILYIHVQSCTICTIVSCFSEDVITLHSVLDV